MPRAFYVVLERLGQKLTEIPPKVAQMVFAPEPQRIIGGRSGASGLVSCVPNPNPRHDRHGSDWQRRVKHHLFEAVETVKWGHPTFVSRSDIYSIAATHFPTTI
jgi:hypothetical protein